MACREANDGLGVLHVGLGQHPQDRSEDYDEREGCPVPGLNKNI
jgi:hypothetical protein